MTAQRSRADKLKDLGVEYPLWVFDVDEPGWPRKHTDVPSDSQPAKMIGWAKTQWEYGTSLFRIDDPCPPGMIDNRPRSSQILQPVEKLLSQLRFKWDATHFQVRYAGGASQELTKPVSDWVCDSTEPGFVSPRRVIRIERTWDGMPLWDRKLCINLWDRSQLQQYTVYGLAIPVKNDSELLKASGAGIDHHGNSIRLASIRLIDGDEQISGVIYPERSHSVRALYFQLGPDDPHNRALLRGTPLEEAPWSEVVKYAKDEMERPL